MLSHFDAMSNIIKTKKRNDFRSSDADVKAKILTVIKISLEKALE